jgi:hypothetical protein
MVKKSEIIKNLRVKISKNKENSRNILKKINDDKNWKSS